MTEPAPKPRRKPAPTKNCKQCGKPIDVNRGVCTHCGYMFPWFKFRLYVGGCSVLLALFGLMIMALSAIFGIAPE